MAVNKVVYGNNTIIDLTGDTVTAADLPSGVTAHDRSGVQITGSASYQPTITVSGILKGDGNGGVTAATAGTDYVATSPVFMATGATSAGPASNPTITIDQSYSTLKSAFDNGQMLFLKLSFTGYNDKMVLSCSYANNSGIRFSCVYGSASRGLWNVYLSSANAVTSTYFLVPNDLTDANGVSF